MAQTKNNRADYNRAYHKAHREECLARSRAFSAAHRKEQRAHSRAYRAAHLEECRATVRAYGSAWTKAHPQENAERVRCRRARIRGATIGAIDLATIKVRDKMLCCICGKKVAEKDLSFDHTIPLVLGGPHSQENLRVAHRRCNYRRGAGLLPVQMVLV